jgi:BirA family transcriptional regulator, biotin operon repressor / biotin---[acetyl-CoA-carboxylase] ligase
MRLEPNAAATGVRLVAHEVVGSTNAEALKLARAGEHGPLWVTAARQTAGRGRRGRTWISEPGNLYASLLLTALPREHRPQLSFVAALAVYDAVAAVAPRLEAQLTIKWPNDLMLGRAKFAGILLEGDGGQSNALVVGIGINCANHPADSEYPATDLAAAGATGSPDTLFAALSLKMLERTRQWNAGRGFSSIRADWLARACGIGEAVRVRLSEREIAGRFEALDPAGSLVLRLPDGTATTVAAGDVFLPLPVAAGAAV